MADERMKLNPKEWEAGAEYLASLRKLGLEPEVLAWGFCSPDARMELVLISSWVDTAGPKALYDLLFAAYDASATPKAINPFIVSVYSPKSVLGDQLAGMIDHARHDPRLPDQKGALLVLGMGEVVVPAAMVYTAKPSRRSKMEELRRFRRFERGITALAA